MSDFDNSRWSDSRFAREYCDQADSYLPERHRLIEIAQSLYRHLVSFCRETRNRGKKPRRGEQILAPGERSEPGVGCLIVEEPRQGRKSLFLAIFFRPFRALLWLIPSGGSLRSPPATLCSPLRGLR
jgi:hypothetical protein